jgi:hypothetical protein
MLKQKPQRFVLIMRDADVKPVSLGQKRTRVSMIVSQPIRLREGAAPIRRVLMFDDHPATIRLLHNLDFARKRNNKLALMGLGALFLLLVLALCWPSL